MDACVGVHSNLTRVNFLFGLGNLGHPAVATREHRALESREALKLQAPADQPFVVWCLHVISETEYHAAVMRSVTTKGMRIVS